MSFSLDLSKAVAKAKGNMNVVVKKTILDIFGKVVMRSPVDSGRFRANWQTKIGNYGRVSVNVVDKDGTATTAKINAAVMKLPFNGQKIFLFNALAYATRLERGWSDQAPVGMVRLTLAEITAHYGK